MTTLSLLATACSGSDSITVQGGVKFSKPLTISNKWLPWPRGQQFVFEGEANRGKGQAPHRVVLIVTYATKKVGGVRSVVVWDRDFQDGHLAEEELSLWAQDDDGNVWNLGEYPEEIDGGKVTGAPSTWLSGVDHAEAGIHMSVDPQVASASYVQGRAPTIEFLDRAKVAQVNQKTCVPVKCYDNVLVTDEWSPLDQPEDGHQLKYHAPGVGIVRIEAIGGEQQETLVLTETNQLDAPALAEANARALELDRRAFDIAANVWRHSPKARLDIPKPT